jgi:hypothetical protein
MWNLSAENSEADHVMPLGQDATIDVIIEMINVMEDHHIWPEGYDAVITNDENGKVYVYTDKLECYDDPQLLNRIIKREIKHDDQHDKNYEKHLRRAFEDLKAMPLDKLQTHHKAAAADYANKLASHHATARCIVAYTLIQEKKHDKVLQRTFDNC